jgi:hypothetical protein
MRGLLMGLGVEGEGTDDKDYSSTHANMVVGVVGLVTTLLGSCLVLRRTCRGHVSKILLALSDGVY